MQKTIQVAVGIVFSADQEILIAQRQAHQEEAFTWEFPGGKIEADETALEGLKRELHEEVGIELIAAQAWFEIEHQYPHKKVKLHIFKVLEFSGIPHGRENQKIKWIPASELRNYPFPHANYEIVERLCQVA